MVHPYFTAKARQFMTRAGGNTDNIEQIAAWAAIAREADHLGHPTIRRRGIIIAQDGRVLAETRLCGRGPGPYVQHVQHDDLERLTGSDCPTRVGLAIGSIARAVGMPVTHATFSDLCEGRAR